MKEKGEEEKTEEERVRTHKGEQYPHNCTHVHAHPIPPNIHTQTYLHLPPKVMQALSVMGLVEKRRKMTYQYSKENRWVLSFDLQEESEEVCLIERGFRFMATHKLTGAPPCPHLH